jgi:RNA polymerase sigma factor (sigma-70 family)
VAWFARKGVGLSRHESPEDLAQGVHMHALEHAGSFEYRGERSFVAWMLSVARQHLAHRIGYWSALKRDAGPLLRITFGAGASTGGGPSGVEPAYGGAGPSTRAGMREQVETAARAMDGLPPRDRELVILTARGCSIREIAGITSLGEAAAQRARHRALDRFRKIYEILERQRGAPAGRGFSPSPPPGPA